MWQIVTAHNFSVWPLISSDYFHVMQGGWVGVEVEDCDKCIYSWNVKLPRKHLPLR